MFNDTYPVIRKSFANFITIFLHKSNPFQHDCLQWQHVVNKLSARNQNLRIETHWVIFSGMRWSESLQGAMKTIHINWVAEATSKEGVGLCYQRRTSAEIGASVQEEIACCYGHPRRHN